MSEKGLSFAKPPLTEVSFSVLFRPLAGFHAGLIGVAWSRFKDRYPAVEERAPLPHEIELFGVLNRQPTPKFMLMDKPECPRLLCFSGDRQYLIQIQKDRFSFNWIGNKSSEYPRFPYLNKLFHEEFEIFSQFVHEFGLGEISVDQIELTYVNNIAKESRLINEIMHDIPSEDRLPKSLEFETVGMALRHIIKSDNGKNIGRLHTSVNYPTEVAGSSENILLRYSARVHPSEGDSIQALGSFDLLRKTINCSFAAMTKQAMHREWLREDDDG